MNDAFKIFADQLRDGHEEEIHENFPPDFIGVKEKDLSFNESVKVDGKAYLAEDSLVLNFDIKAFAMIPCAVCNSLVRTEIAIHNFYHAEPLSEIKSGIFHLQEILREVILLETPQFAECNQGKCSEREKISKYLKTPIEGEIPGKSALMDDGYRPFSDLELK
ncbi:MAG TPA: hypothetical protein PLC42_06210 [Parachlamydiaceae bacterium]|nr:hypothetical protein [Parachlamydiaceae bacterium]